MVDLESVRQSIHDVIMGLTPDPFADVYEACEPHRRNHGAQCGVYPSNPVGMRFNAVLVKAVRPKRLLEIGSGIGYSALHLAAAAGEGALLDSIERDALHVKLARAHAERALEHAPNSSPIRFIEGEAENVIPDLAEPYDFVYDDGWFAKEPTYLDAMIDSMRPGAVVVMANWFLLEDAVTGQLRNDWASFSGTCWAEDVKAYAATLASHPRLEVAFDLPLTAVGVKVTP